MSDAVFIIDSYALIYRAYFAFINHPLTNSAGDNISALIVFFQSLRSLISKYKPQYLAAAFDSRTKTFRHELYPEYKATRDKAPEDLHSQVPLIEDVLRALKVPVLCCDGFEADDIIATVARRAAESGLECRILSGDKDLLQLVTDTCKELQTNKDRVWVETGPREVFEKWGVEPRRILDYLSLVGDSSDNVPGVKGIGDKTAQTLLREYGSLDGIYENAALIKGAVGRRLIEGKESAYFSRRLITLRDDVPIEINFEDLSTAHLDFNAAADALSRYEAPQIALSFRRIAGAESAGGAAQRLQPVLVRELGGEDALHGDAGANPPNAGAGGEPPASHADAAPAVRQNKGDYRACVTERALSAFISEVLASEEKCVALDTETDSLDTHRARLVGFSMCREAGKGIYVPVIANAERAETCIDKDRALRLLDSLFSNEGVTLVMHNGKFDLEVFYHNGLSQTVRCKLFDTMVAAWVLDSEAPGASPYGLESLGETRLGLKGIEFSDIVKKGETFMDVPLETAVSYCAEDSDFTFRLFEKFRGELARAGLEDLFYNIEMKVLPILVSMEMTGIHLDSDKLREYKDELSALISEKESAIYREAGEVFNISSPKQLQTILFEKRGLPHGKRTKTGYSTDTASLEEIAALTNDKLPSMILEYRKYTKLQSTYVETLPQLADENGRVHTSFLQTGTATGRLSSRDPNLQNIPVREEAGRRIRSAFTATAGHTLISADYSQIELVVLAHLSGDEALCRAFREGVDVHRATAALIYGVKPDDVTAEERRFAKTVNFGVMYGMSAFRLAKELGINRTRAQDFINRYFDTYSGVRRFLDEIVAFARKTGYVQTITGRRRRIPEIKSRNRTVAQSAARIAVNTPIQGSAADIVKRAMILVSDAFAKTELDVKMLLQVHDELIFECRADDEAAAEAIIKREMEGAASLRVPLRVKCESGENWGMFH